MLVYVSSLSIASLHENVIKWVINTVNRRRADNTMAKRKSAKGQTTINKTLHRKVQIEQHEPN